MMHSLLLDIIMLGFIISTLVRHSSLSFVPFVERKQSVKLLACAWINNVSITGIVCVFQFRNVGHSACQATSEKG